MGKRRRKDKAHDVGDSMPGTVGDSQGTIHDGQGVPTFTPDEAAVPAERNKPPNQRHENKSSSNHGTAIEEQQKEEEKQTTRMEYAKKYGDSWPGNRQRRFLREHDVTAKEMGWKLTE